MSGISTEYYNHCDGSQLRLTDSDLGSEQYISSDYYVWNAGPSAQQLLFIFPTRVNLTTITLHYYHDSTRGFPRLRFYAVPDDFNIWNTLAASYSRVDIAAVPLDVEPAGRRNYTINFNFTTKKVLLYKYSYTLAFVVSEVEFFACIGKQTNTISYYELDKTTDSEQDSSATTAAMFTRESNTNIPGWY